MQLCWWAGNEFCRRLAGAAYQAVRPGRACLAVAQYLYPQKAKGGKNADFKRSCHGAAGNICGPPEKPPRSTQTKLVDF